MHRLFRHAPLRFIAGVLAAAGLGTGGVVSATASPASAGTGTAAACEVTWGSGAKRVYDYSPYWIVDARAGRHDCYDRFVVDVADSATGYDVKYVDEVYATGYDVAPGVVVPLRGGAKLQVVVNSPAYGPDGYTFRDRNATELVDVSGYRTFRQVAYAGVWRLDTTFGLGVRARLPYRVFILPGTTARIVVDVAHHGDRRAVRAALVRARRRPPPAA